MSLNVDLDPILAEALRRYAKDGARNMAGVTRIALRRMIPQRYFDALEAEAEAVAPVPQDAA